MTDPGGVLLEPDGRGEDPDSLAPLRGNRAGLPRDRFVGRETDRTGVVKLLETGHRAVTLVAPPGLGKTRLALEVARAGTGWSGGVWLVDLVGLAAPELVDRTVAAALGIEQWPGVPDADRIVTVVGDTRLLVVLDGAEHFGDSPKVLVRRLLRDCPGVCVLATGVAPLGIKAEEVWRLPPLAVPDADTSAGEELLGYEAVELFVERSRTGPEGLVMDGLVAPAVAEICRLLDGNPLAIELAAARGNGVDPVEMVEALAYQVDHHHPEVASNGGRPKSRSAKGRGLDAVMAWSYRLLSTPEQLLLRRLSVFGGGSTLGSAEAVCSGIGLPASQVFECLARLVSLSFLTADTSGAEARYRLPEPVRRFAAGALVSSGESVEVAERHASWCTALMEQAQGQLLGAERSTWLATLDLEIDNLRGALAWSIEHDNGPRTLRLVSASTHYWVGSGAMVEGRRWFEQGLALAEGSPPQLRASALWGAAYLAWSTGDSIAAEPLLHETLAIGRALEDDQVCARALLLLGSSVPDGLSGGEGGRLDVLDQCAAASRAIPDGWALARALAASGAEQLRSHELVEARQSWEQSVAVARQFGDMEALASGLVRIGTLVHAGGDSWSAKTFLEEAERVAREGTVVHEWSLALTRLGAVELEGGEQRRARQAFMEGAEVARKSGFSPARIEALCHLARMAWAEGDEDEAERLFADAEVEARSIARRACVAMAGRSRLLADKGDARLRAATGQIRRAKPTKRTDPGGALMVEAVAAARDVGDEPQLAAVLLANGNLLRARDDIEGATAAFQESMSLFRTCDQPRGMVDALEAVGGVAVAYCRYSHGARLMGAAATVRETHRFRRFGPDCPYFDVDVATLHEQLIAEDLEAAWYEGAAMSLADAIEMGCRELPEGDGGGWERLTKAERGVVALVAEGLTNRQIGERLFVSRHTVQTHLAHVFAKLGISSRTVLARETTSRQQATRRSGGGPVGLPPKSGA